MQNSNLADRRSELEQLSTQQLDQMLQEELQKTDGNPAEVKLILGILKEREKDSPVQPGGRDGFAWKKYMSRLKLAEDKSVNRRGWVLRAACITAVLCVLFVTVSSEVEADTFWERLVRWSDSVIEFFSPEDSSGGHKKYVFETEHPGLQQVYDAVVNLGVTEAVVPMWLPEGYELISCKEMSTKKKTTLTAYFRNGEKEINYNVAVYSESVRNRYQKDDIGIRTITIEGIEFYMVRNTDAWVTVWTKDNIECSISVDCQEDELYKILRSIYDKEEN